MNYRRMLLLSMFFLLMILPLYFIYQHFMRLMNVAGVRKPDVVLITIDTLHYAALGAYGNSLVQTPFIDSLALRSVQFPRGYAPIPTTGPSHTTLLTGRSPASHRVFRNAIRYSGNFKTLARVFHDMNYRTAAFVSGYSLTAKVSGLDSGFDFYDDSWSESQLERDGSDAVDACISWLDTSDRTKPFFLWIHLFDPHSPYQEREPFIRTIRNMPARGNPEENSSDETAERYARHVEDARKNKDFMVLVRNPMTTEADQESVDRHWTAYLSEVSYVDSVLARLKRYLQQTNHWERSLVMLTADHGEGFDHDYFFAHGDRLWESAVKVPWILKTPLSSKPTLARSVMRHEDLFPTCMSIAGFDLPVPGLEGVDLKTIMELNLVGVTSSWTACAPPLPRKNFSQGLVVSIYNHHFKLIRTLGRAEEELFHLTDDPGETTDVSVQYPKMKERLSTTLDKIIARSGYPRAVDFDPAEIKEEEKLRSLGYIQ